jgi:hypothetical protein
MGDKIKSCLPKFLFYRGLHAMIYVENIEGCFVECFDLEDFEKRFEHEYQKIKEHLFNEFMNNDLYDETDTEEVYGFVDELLTEDRIKETWNDAAYLCDVYWKIVYIGNEDFYQMAEDLIEKNYNELKDCIAHRLIAYKNDDRYPDKEDDELTNFMLENFNEENL